MTSPVPAPSRWAERLLAAVIHDRDWREAVLGDLREEYDATARRSGVRAARRWHWGQTLRLTGRRLSGGRSQRPPRRDMSGIEPIEPRHRFSGLGRDVSYALRSIGRRPALSTVIVVALALGLAANATIFSIADALILRPYRFPGVDRLVVIGSVAPHEFFDRESVAPADFLDWKAQTRTVTGLAAIEWWEPNLVGRDEPVQLAGFRVSPEYFDTARIIPTHGRSFLPTEGEIGLHRRVVLSHRLWAVRFQSDPAAVGQAILLDGEPHEIVGVAPPGYQVPLGAEIWAPAALTPEDRIDRRSSSLIVVGRLAAGARLEDAQAEFETIVSRLRREHPDTNANRAVTVQPFMRGMADSGADAFIAIWQTAALLLLLVACANIVNLLLARGVDRQQEFAVRLALGAGRARIVRQLLIEGVALAGAAAALAAPLAWVGVTLCRQVLPPSVIRFVPGWEYLHVQPRTLLLTAALAAVATLIFSLAPAIQAARYAIADSLRQGARTLTAGPGRAWGRAALASVQIGLTLALLTASGLSIAAAHDATRGAHLGFDAENVLVARLLLPNTPYDDVARRRQFVDDVLGGLSAIPAVQVAGVSSAIPAGSQSSSRPFYPEGVSVRPSDVRRADLRIVTPHYLDTLRIPIIAGRPLTDQDHSGTRPVALVSRSLVDRYWPGADPLGRRFRLAETGEWIEVVGVVGDVTQDWFMQQRNPTVYRPVTQQPPYNLNILVRTVGDPASLAGDLRRSIVRVDPNQPIRELVTMRQLVDDRAVGLSFAAKTLTIMGLVALFLALMGIYSLMAYLANRRTQEIGVRLAFGATSWDVVRLTVGQAGRITLVGVAVGALLATAVGWAMQAVMFGAVSASVGLTASLAVVLAMAALAASYLPARRAATLDPTMALRAE
jgi:putative ABC transport system permease protein